MRPERHPPLLQVIFDALRDRGWTVADGYIDPEGNRFADLGDAIYAQSLREIAAMTPDDRVG